MKSQTNSNQQSGLEIAIIGMAGRFPGAETLDQYWRNLCNGIESTTILSDHELQSSGIDPALLCSPNYVKVRAILDNVETFDAPFFGLHPKEAEIMDPQHRLFLECAWEAFENAGYDPEEYKGPIGVYAGTSMNSYMRNLDLGGSQKSPAEQYQIFISNDKDFLPTRVSYKLNLKGPSINVQTACSTSLVAVHLACQALLSGECDMALAGAVSISLPHKIGYLYQEGMIFSPDGHCRAFDAKAHGTISGDGAGIVVLKRLADAKTDGDRIEAVIRGSAINNDGALKVGYTAPSVDGQANVIRAAQLAAEVEPDTVSYVEAHGTGTELGDPIEIAALTKAFRAGTQKKNFCAIGSVKSNFGHLDVAAGMAGLIKTVLALKNGLLPPSLHFEQRNPKIDFDNSPFYVNTKLSSWQPDHAPRRAGISSFGIGGTNAHLILEEAPASESSTSFRTEQLLLLSAKTESALEQATKNLSAYLRSCPEADLGDVAFTLQTGRRRFVHRRALVCRDRTDAVDALERGDSKRLITRRAEQTDASVAFMFPGQGAQYVNMGFGLYESEPVFRESVDECAEVLARHLGVDLRTILYPEPSQSVEAERKITETFVTQPALFVIEYALAQVWMHWGIRPKMLIGHSLGEYVAACLAGVMSRDEALLLVAERARLMQQLPGGAMLAVRLSSKQVEPFLGVHLSIAAINAPSVTVVSGPYEAIEVLEAQLAKRDIGFRQLATSHAFHSEMLDPVLEPFTEIVKKVSLHPPRIPWVSCLTGDWITMAQATDPHYWVQQLRQPVDFARGVEKLVEYACQALMEVGPARTLSTYVKQYPVKPPDCVVLTSFQQEQSSSAEMESMLHSLGQLWLAGARVDWPHVHGSKLRRRVALPTYPFERKRYWIAPQSASDQSKSMSVTGEAGPVLRNIPHTESGEKTMTEPVVTPSGASRKTEVLSRVQRLFSDLSGMDLAALNTSVNFMELGFDSLFLTQASTAINQTFNVNVSFRQLLENVSTMDALATYLNETMPEEKTVGSTTCLLQNQIDQAHSGEPVAPTTAHASFCLAEEATVSSNSGALERIVTRQLELMSRQLDLLRNGSQAAQDTPWLEQAPLRQNGRAKESLSVLMEPPNGKIHGAAANGTAHLVPEKVEPTTFGPYAPTHEQTNGALTPHQQKHLDALIGRYTGRTKESKRYTQIHRAHLADPRAVAGFRSIWKELTYPIVVARSSGCKLWDVDGNEYVDLINGFGSSLFGYSPPFIAEAIESQLKNGIEIGPQSSLAGEVAAMIRELTGMERVAFCNTGSEAVMASLRVARTVTGRNKIAVFSGSYHGTFDEVLVRSGGTEALTRPRPIAPGIVPSMVENVLVLEYDSAASLETLKRHAHELAAVLVEPVQSRRPDLQPKEFLRAVREITTNAGTALIMDEMITGFRSHPGGVQEVFGVKGDLATYGKVVGGGLPIGILAGKSRFMDTLDGGMWNFGDRSYPGVGMTFFAGTFVRHPLALAAAKAVLNHLKQNGPDLQNRLNVKTAELVGTLNAHADQVGVPIRINHFSSWFCINFPRELPLASLFFTYMREKGVHLLEGRPCFLTTAHTDSDLQRVIVAFKESVAAMQEAGFLPSESVAGSNEKPLDPIKSPLSFPLTDAQRELWFAAQMGAEVSRGFVDVYALHLRGPLQIEVLRKAIQELVDRHDALRTTFSENGEEQQVAPRMVVGIPLTDLSYLERSERNKRFTQLTAAENEDPVDLVRGPLLRTRLVKMEEQHHVLLLRTHHIAVDGWSGGVLFSELAIIYSAGCRGEAHNLRMPAQFVDYATWQASPLQSDKRAASETYWLEQFKDPAPILELPTDRSRPLVQTYNGAREQMILPPSLCEGLRRVAAQRGSTLFAALFAGFNVLLHRLTGQEDIVVAIPAAGQAAFDARDLVGHCVNFLPLRTRINGETGFSDCLRTIKRLLLDAHERQYCTYGRLLQKLKLPRNTSRAPLVSVSFNVDRNRGKLDFEGLDVDISVQPKSSVNLDSKVNLVETESDIKADWHYNTDLFDSETIRRWLEHYRTVLEAVVANPEQRLAELSLFTGEEQSQMLAEWNDNSW